MRYPRDLHGYGANPPSRMGCEEFVSHFGDVFEHSAWIAERAFANGLGPANDTAAGLHAALTGVFRGADETERMAVLLAHPDLAGKLAAAKRLTPSSLDEQAHAGLDALTDAERAGFQDLNERYRRRFGFPFIMAVKGHDRHAILAAFERRLANEEAQEFRAACREVERIARLRLEDMLPN